MDPIDPIPFEHPSPLPVARAARSARVTRDAGSGGGPGGGRDGRRKAPRRDPDAVQVDVTGLEPAGEEVDGTAADPGQPELAPADPAAPPRPHIDLRA